MLTSLALLIGLAGAATPDNDTFLIGRGIADITLPVVGVPMLGYVRADQIVEGIHQRQYARAFVIRNPRAEMNYRVALVTCDIAFPTHTLKLAVLERLRNHYYESNLVIAGTHTHAAPGGFHHHLAASALGGQFFGQCFDAVADGIAEAVLAAEADMKPGRILFAQGEIEGAGVNRSRVAYMRNPADERARYDNDVDTTMTLLKFVRDDGVIGVLNWFPVHGTSMSHSNTLTSGDNKGYAAYALEQKYGGRYSGQPQFVAAFAQSTAGDVTPNLNLNGTGPGRDDIESTRIIGERQARAAQRLMDRTAEPLRGDVHCQFDMIPIAKLMIGNNYTGVGPRWTCASAFGYSFAAGSAEDGGGHPLFQEGMTQSRPGIDALVRSVAPNLSPTEALSTCQKPKPILFATGLAKPPAQDQVVPIGIVRIGQLVILVGPAEFTTMAGRRIREAVANALNCPPKYVVLAGYANDYAGYVTTREEYESQQYEGGHTLFGPWTEAAYRQEFVYLATVGHKVQDSMEDMRRRNLPNTSLEGPDDLPPPGAKFGDVIVDARDRYKPGERVEVQFWTGSPVNDYRRTDHYLLVEQRDPQTGQWKTWREDFDWDTTCRWKQILRDEAGKSPLPGFRIAPVVRIARPEPFQATIAWQTDSNTPAGSYRIVLLGRYKKDGKVERFPSRSREFQVTK